MEKRYFFWFSALFLVGVGLSAKGIILCLGLTALFLVCAFLLRKRGFTKLCIFLAAGILSGTLLFSWQFADYKNTAGKLADKEITISGRIEEVKKGEKPRLLVRGEIRTEEETFKNMKVYVYPEAVGKANYGSTVIVKGKAYIAKPPRNFGETDYRLYAMGKGVSAFLYPEAEDIAITGSEYSPLRPMDWASVLRRKAQSAIKNRMSAPAEGFLKAYLTGNTDLISADSEESLKVAGLSHVVAVSGMHLTMLTGAFMLLFGVLKIRKRLFSVAIYILLTWFFVLFTGAGTSVLRAALMLTVFFLSDFFRRDHDGLTALSFAAFSLCAANPGTFFDVGFQLSCASTLTILLFSDKFRTRFLKLPRFFRNELSLYASASIGFVPVMAVQFGSFCTVGALANLLVAPFLTPVLIGGFMGIFLAPVPIISDIIFFCLDKAVLYILVVAELCAFLPFSQVFLKPPGVMLCIGYIFLAVALLFLLDKKVRRAGVICIIALSLVTADGAVNLIGDRTTSVTFLSVGHGDCALVTGKDGAYLFDSGGNELSDVAENTVIPFLRRQGISKIRGAFLTHYHMDHGEAFKGLLAAGMIETLYLPYHEDDTLKRELAILARENGVRVRYLGDGDVITAGGIKVTSYDTAAGSDENNGMMYSLEAEGTRVLFTGDMDEEGQRRLLYRGADIDCDILKIPHHGGGDAFFGEFADAASPSVAVVSCGKNLYGHPQDFVLSEYAERGAAVYRTDQCGTVEIRLYPGGRRQIKTLYKNS